MQLILATGFSHSANIPVRCTWVTGAVHQVVINAEDTSQLSGAEHPNICNKNTRHQITRCRAPKYLTQCSMILIVASAFHLLHHLHRLHTHRTNPFQQVPGMVAYGSFVMVKKNGQKFDNFKISVI
jgi:hypothetical protein